MANEKTAVFIDIGFPPLSASPFVEKPSWAGLSYFGVRGVYTIGGLVKPDAVCFCGGEAAALEVRWPPLSIESRFPTIPSKKRQQAAALHSGNYGAANAGDARQLSAA
jgi:hypothetical protein